MPPSMNGLVKDLTQNFQYEVLISGGDSELGGGAVPGTQSKIAVSRPRVSLEYLNKNPNARLLTPKYYGSFTLFSLTNISYQVNLISLLGPYFTVVCKMKPGDDC